MRVETKVTAASLAAAVSGAIVWALSTFVFHGVVPEGVQTIIDIVIPAGLAFASGWVAKHTPRQAPAPTEPAPPAT